MLPGDCPFTIYALHVTSCSDMVVLQSCIVRDNGVVEEQSELGTIAYNLLILKGK